MMLDDSVRAFVEEVPAGVLATTRADGRSRQSVVYHVLDGDRLLISTESKRGKARDVERTGWASLCVVGSDRPFPSVTLEGPARIRRTDIGPPTARIIERILGAPADAVQTDNELAAIDRVILEIEVGRVYGASYLSS
jgi:PPOX class probable F420-dependent enzyme